MKKQSFIAALLAVLFLRLFTSLFLAVVSSIIPVDQCPQFPCSQSVYEGLVSNGDFSRNFLAPWYRWDTHYFIEMASDLYTLDDLKSTTWPPLYPIAIRLFSGLFTPMGAALFISTAAAFLALYLLHRIVSEQYDIVTADLTLALYALFPTSFFLVGAYTESLFIMFVLASFFFLRRKQWVWAGCMAFLATLTRYQGVFLALPFLWEGYQLYGLKLRNHWKEMVPILFSLVAAPAAFTLNALYIHFIIGAPWPWLTKSQAFDTTLAFPGWGIIKNIAAIFSTNDLFSISSTFFDTILLLLVIFLLLRKAKDFPISYRIYSWIMLLPSLTMIHAWGRMTGVSRFILPVFPGFILLALFLYPKNRLKLLWFGLSFLGQCVLLFAFYNWIWVA